MTLQDQAFLVEELNREETNSPVAEECNRLRQEETIFKATNQVIGAIVFLLTKEVTKTEVKIPCKAFQTFLIVITKAHLICLQ